MDFKAVIFDLDGTLLDTLEDLADSMNRVLERNRLPQQEVEAYRYFVGDGIDMLVRRALPFEIADEEELDRFIREMKREYAGRWTQKTRPYPGILEVLAAFSAAGFELAVLSNKPDEATQHIVRALLLGVSFRLVIGATREKPKKPDPTVALEIADRLRIAPARFIYVGDTAIDMRTAVAAGMFPVGALWGFRPAEELIAAGAELLVRKPASLLPWVPRAAAGGPCSRP
jgi:phosphoglycolate phosphatase